MKVACTERSLFQIVSVVYGTWDGTQELPNSLSIVFFKLGKPQFQYSLRIFSLLKFLIVCFPKQVSICKSSFSFV